VAYGDQRKFITALVTLDEIPIRAWARNRGFEEEPLETLAARPEVRELIEGEIAAANETLASFERVKRFRILPRDLTIEGGELTPTLKIKRKVVIERYRLLVEEMYAA
jgi:long-chain acyl-CoA synthetase